MAGDEGALQRDCSNGGSTATMSSTTASLILVPASGSRMIQCERFDKIMRPSNAAAGP